MTHRPRSGPGRFALFISEHFGRIILVAAPIVIFVAIAWACVEGMYRYYQIRVPQMSPVQSLTRTAALTYNAPPIIWNGLLAALDRDAVPQASPLPTFRLRVETGSIEEMAGNLPFSAKQRYYQAELQYPDGTWQRIDYRFRGRSAWHWMPEKPSLRLRLSRDRPLGFRRHVNLTNPEDRAMVSNFMGDELARRLGVLSFDSRFARVFINGLFYGVYQLTLHEDEGFLLAQVRVPGPLYIGDNLQDPWRSETFEVRGDTDVLHGFDPMEKLVGAIYHPLGPERYARLWGILSQKQYAQWMAATNLTGGTHTDSFHNHLYYFDPRMGKLEPAMVDAAGHGMFHYVLGRKQLSQGFEPDPTIPINEPREPLKDSALRDPRFYHARNVALFDAMAGSASAADQHRLLDRVYRDIDPDVYADRRKAGLRATFAGSYRVPYSNAQYEAEKLLLYDWIVGRENFLRGELARTTVSVKVADAGARGKSLVLVRVDGHSAAQFELSSVTPEASADVSFDGSFARTVGDKPLLLYPGLTENNGELHRFVRVYRIPDHVLEPAAQSYLFEVATGDADSLSEALRTAFRNAVTGEDLTPAIQRVRAIDPKAIPYNETSVHAWRFPQEPTGTTVLGPGSVTLSTDLVIGPQQDLIVQPGTRLQLGPGVSIISRGPTHFKGTAAAAVTIERLFPDEPWGSIAVIGSAANGSSFSYVRASGGSSGGQAHRFVAGMVAAYGVSDFRMEESRLGGNVGSDDLLHIVYGNFDLKNMSFVDCFADCIDIDLGVGSIGGAEIRNAGNDGIDLMLSEVSVSDLVVVAAGDKGISIGERSQLTAKNLEISGAVNGVAVKDRSTLDLSTARFSANETAIAVFAKNWRYGGPGRVRARAITFLDNDVSVSVDEGGELLLLGQPLPDRRQGAGLMQTNPGDGS